MRVFGEPQPTTESSAAPNAERLYAAARDHLAGGVSAAARIHASLGRPFMTARGEGGRVYDVDGKAYIDLNTSNGATLLGHGHPAVRRAIEHALDLGILCAHETAYQSQVARKISELVPCAELVRFTTSGTETTWYALRTARAFTGKARVVKFEGHFHGYNDYLGYSAWPPLDRAGPVDTPIAYVESGGIPAELQQFVIVLPWNDTEALERTLRAHGHEIAAVIMEPINYNSGAILPRPGYLEAARRLTREHGVLLIFDEILSGFRTGSSCAQGYFGVTPDLCTLGKALGGGTPLSAFAGRREVMDAVSPTGAAVHSGTFNAHLISLLAADAFLDEIGQPAFWSNLEQLENAFYPAVREAFERAGLPVWVQAVGSRFSLLFGLDREPTSYREAAGFDRAMAGRFFAAAMDEGVYFHFAWHHGLCAMHTPAELDQAVAAIEVAARRAAAGSG
jgi:glutamate-1-semialdehyde 2,1-aminomutase